MFAIVSYFFQVSHIKDCEGNMKCNTIAKLSLCVLLLPHGNADPERRNTGSFQNGQRFHY